MYQIVFGKTGLELHDQDGEYLCTLSSVEELRAACDRYLETPTLSLWEVLYRRHRQGKGKVL